MGNGKYYFALISAAGGSGFNHGFHLILFNTLLPVIMEWTEKIKSDHYYDDEDEMPDLLKSKMLAPFLIACFGLGAIFGSFLIGILASMGRKKVLLITSCISLLALFFLAVADFTELFEVLIIGRVIMGFSVGISSGISPMYLVEIAPFCVRGCAGCLYYVMVAISMTFANILAIPNGMGDLDTWCFLYVVALAPPIIQLVSLLFCPESPKFLYFNQDDEDEAHIALAWLRDENVDREMEELKEEYTVLKEITFTVTGLFNNQLLRSPFIISVVIMLGQQLCGVEAILYYSTFILQGLLENHKDHYTKAMNCSIGLGVCLFLTSVLSMVLSDKLGRKNLLLLSFVGMMSTTTLLALIYLLTSHKEDLTPNIHTTAAVFLFLFVVSYGLGAGPIPWLYVAEINNHSARPWVVCISVSLKWICQFIIVLVFLGLKYKMGVYFLTAFLAFDLVVVIFLVLTMRETMMMSSLDIMDLFYD